MSYSIQLSGHSSEDHNDAVKAIAKEAQAKLAALPGSSGVTLAGYSSDNTGSIALTTEESLAEPVVEEAAKESDTTNA